MRCYVSPSGLGGYAVESKGPCCACLSPRFMYFFFVVLFFLLFLLSSWLLLLLSASGRLRKGLSEVIDLGSGGLILRHWRRTKTGRGAEPMNSSA